MNGSRRGVVRRYKGATIRHTSYHSAWVLVERLWLGIFCSSSTFLGVMATTKLPAGSKGADYHRQCTGAALKTAQAHSQLPSNGLSLFGAAFCPFVHRVWIALEYVKASYRYVEVDPYQKPRELLDINPRGLVPGIRLEDVNGQVQGLGESTVILEYINELFVESQDTTQTRMLPPMNSESNVYLRAKTRLVAHHLNAKLIPAFYRFLQAQDTDKQVQFGQEFVEELKSFQDELEAADPTEKSAAGPFFGGSEELTLVDISIAPWCFRATNVLSKCEMARLEEVSQSLTEPR